MNEFAEGFLLGMIVLAGIIFLFRTVTEESIEEQIQHEEDEEEKFWDDFFEEEKRRRPPSLDDWKR